MTDTPKIYGCMADIMAEISAIKKDSRNQAQGFNYRGIDSVYNAINPLLVKHRVFMSATIIEKTREERTNQKGTVLAFTCLRMRYRFVADDGSFVETEAEGEGMDSGDKSSNKAMAVAHKYALLQAFCIPTEDMADPDTETHEITSKNQDAPRQAPAKDSAPAPKQQSTERQQKAANWAYEAKGFVESVQEWKALEKWVTDNAKTMDAAFNLAPNAHKILVDAIDARRQSLNPLAAE